MQLPWITEAEKVIGLHEVRDITKLSAWRETSPKFGMTPQRTRRISRLFATR